MTDGYTHFSGQGEAQGRPPLAARSRLVSDFFDHLNRQDISWVVMNNYEDLPEMIPSDIDLSIPPGLFHRLDGFIEDFAKKSDACIVQKLWHGNMKCAYILATGAKGAREFVQLDFFTAFSTKGCPALITHEELVDGRSAFRNFYVPRPEVELVFTAMRRLFKNDWSSRHCARIAKLHSKVSGFDWLPQSYMWLRPTLEAAIRGDVEATATRREADWDRLRATARSRLSLPEAVANAVLQFRRIITRLRDETGHLVILAAPREGLSARALDALELVFHRRLFIDGPSSMTLIAKLAILKRRKGLIFVLAGAGHPEGQALGRRLARMGLADQMLYTVAGSSSELAGCGVAATELNSDADVIEAILTVQAAKAAAAIARGGTQTSGGLDD